MSFVTAWSGERLDVGTLRQVLDGLPDDAEIEVAYETIGAPVVEVRTDGDGVILVIP